MKDLDFGKDLIKKKIPLVANSPGVYRMLGRKNQVLYVGKAKNLLIESSEHAERPLIFWILAAQAANYFGSRDDRDRLLRKISAESSEAEEAVMYMRISFHIEEGHHREAVRLLLDIRANGVLSEFWLNSLVECYRALGEDRKIEALLPELKARASAAN